MVVKLTFKCKRLISLFAISAKMDLVWLLRDTKFAFTAILADTISNLSVVSSVYLIALRFGGIGGMSVDEVLFMMAYSTVTTGIFILFGSGNNIHISRIIGRGQLEHLFVQPLSLKTQLITSGFSPFTGSGNFIIGCILLVIAILPACVCADDSARGKLYFQERTELLCQKRLQQICALRISPLMYAMLRRPSRNGSTTIPAWGL